MTRSALIAGVGCPIEVVTDMSKRRRPGFLDDQPTDGAFSSLSAMLRESGSSRSL